jgi:hypothetical protein
MGRRSRGPRIALGPVLLFAFTIVGGCTPRVTSTQPPASTPEPTARPSPTPVPTVLVTRSPTEPTDTEPAELVIRFTSCSHTCGPEPGTTVLADGRIIWTDSSVRPIEATLTPEALRRVRDELDASGVLDVPADYHAELRPGATPVGHGATLLRFERRIGGARVVVTSGDPSDYADQPRAWIIPPEMAKLASLARQLREPLAWLGQDAFLDPPKPYLPERYVVVVDLYPEVGEQPDDSPDVDDVEWPFGQPIEGVGEPADSAGGGLGARCLIVDDAIAVATVAAERAAGARRDINQWLSTQEYGWDRANGFVDVSMTPLLPHETGSCVGLIP